MSLDIKNLPKKEGIIFYDQEKVMYVVGYKWIAKVAQALSSETRTKIIDLLKKGPEGLDEIADKLGQSKANVSSQIRKLEEVNIVAPTYQPGARGIKKLVELKVKAIVFVLAPDEDGGVKEQV